MLTALVVSPLSPDGNVPMTYQMASWMGPKTELINWSLLMDPFLVNVMFTPLVEFKVKWSRVASVNV